VSEVVGYKSGLALTRQELLDSIPDEDTARLIDESDQALVILRSEEFQQIIIDILYRLGNIASANYEWPTDELFRKYRRDSRRRKIARQVVDLFIEFMNSPSEKSSTGPVDTVGFLMLVLKRYGVAGVRIASEFLNVIRRFMHLDPFANIRDVFVERVECRFDQIALAFFVFVAIEMPNRSSWRWCSIRSSTAAGPRAACGDSRTNTCGW